jgi:hypothetical protein
MSMTASSALSISAYNRRGGPPPLWRRKSSRRSLVLIGKEREGIMMKMHIVIVMSVFAVILILAGCGQALTCL